MALAYTGIIVDKKHYLDVSELFDTEDSSEEVIDQHRLEKWVSQEHNRNYIQNKLSYKVQNRVETCIPAGRKNEMQSLSNGNRNEKPSIRGRVLILLTNPRSGSTWFTDAMYNEGHFQCVSFHWSKTLAIGQGGAILHDNDEADAWFRKARFDGRTEGVAPKDDNLILGYHAYMSPRDAAEGLSRLAVLPSHNDPLLNDDYPDLSKMEIFK